MDIDATTPVWYKGLDNWTVAANIDELRDLMSPSHQDEIIEEPARVSTPPQWDRRAQSTAREPQQAPAQRPARVRKSRSGMWVTLGIVAALAIILTITNPKKEDHCREITNVSRSWITETIDNFHMNNIVGGVVKTASTWLIRSAVDENVKVDNYVLFSIGYIDTGAEKTRVSLGILGNVFTFNKEQLDEKVKEIISKYVQDAVGLGDFFSFDTGNINQLLVDGILDMIDDNMFGGRSIDHDDAIATGQDDSQTNAQNSGSSLNLPVNEDLLREGAKLIIKEGADYLIDQVDDIGR